jgi:acetylornithine aminotransferase
VLTTAKALGNGFPIGATIVSDAVAAQIATGDHGTTFGGNPLACRVAHHVFGRLADAALQRAVADKGLLLRRRLERLQARFPQLVSQHGVVKKSATMPTTTTIIGASAGEEKEEGEEEEEEGGGKDADAALDAIRGRGFVQGLQLTRDPTPVITAARERGLLVISCGVNTLRFVPPLVLERAQLEEGMDILEEAMAHVVESTTS